MRRRLLPSAAALALHAIYPFSLKLSAVQANIPYNAATGKPLGNNIQHGTGVLPRERTDCVDSQLIQQDEQRRYSHPAHEQTQQSLKHSENFDSSKRQDAPSVATEDDPLPDGWAEYVDPSSGRPYYHHFEDGITTWTRPVREIINVQEEVPETDAVLNDTISNSTHIEETENDEGRQSMVDNPNESGVTFPREEDIQQKSLPAPWEEYRTPEGIPYFYNRDTSESTYDRPVATEVDNIKQDSVPQETFDQPDVTVNGYPEYQRQDMEEKILDKDPVDNTSREDHSQSDNADFKEGKSNVANQWNINSPEREESSSWDKESSADSRTQHESDRLPFVPPGWSNRDNVGSPSTSDYNKVPPQGYSEAKQRSENDPIRTQQHHTDHQRNYQTGSMSNPQDSQWQNMKHPMAQGPTTGRPPASYYGAAAQQSGQIGQDARGMHGHAPTHTKQTLHHVLAQRSPQPNQGEYYGQGLNPPRQQNPEGYSTGYPSHAPYGQNVNYGQPHTSMQTNSPRSQMYQQQPGRELMQQNSDTVRDALGSAWQSVLGFGRRAGEAASSATENVVASAANAKQAIGSTSLGLWDRAKQGVEQVGKSFFEDNSSGTKDGGGYSLSQYGVPPATNQGQERVYPNSWQGGNYANGGRGQIDPYQRGYGSSGHEQNTYRNPLQGNQHPGMSGAYGQGNSNTQAGGYRANESPTTQSQWGQGSGQYSQTSPGGTYQQNAWQQNTQRPESSQRPESYQQTPRRPENYQQNPQRPHTYQQNPQNPNYYQQNQQRSQNYQQ